MGQNIQLEAADGFQLGAYVAEPAAAAKGAAPFISSKCPNAFVRTIRFTLRGEAVRFLHSVAYIVQLGTASWSGTWQNGMQHNGLLLLDCCHTPFL